MRIFQNEVEYPGNIISEKGLRPSDTGIESIKKLTRPQNLFELKSFLGKGNYYGKFIPNLAQISGPLNSLRRKSVKFTWGEIQEQVFEELKKRLMKATTLCPNGIVSSVNLQYF